MPSDDPSDEWYAAIGSDLSQGDIVRLAPYGHIDSPITICQPHNKDLQGKANYYPLNKIQKRRSVEFLHAKFEIGVGIVVWPDCQIDKRKNQGEPESQWLVGIAPVLPLTKLTSNLHNNVRLFNRAQWFPLPEKLPHLPESYVDLRYIWTVQYVLLSDRIIALSQSARQLFSVHRFWFESEVRVRSNVECPHCHQSFDSSALFKYKDIEEDEEPGR